MYLCEGVGALLRMRMQYHEDRDRDGLCEVPRRVADATAEDADAPAGSLHDGQKSGLNRHPVRWKDRKQSDDRQLAHHRRGCPFRCVVLKIEVD